MRILGIDIGGTKISFAVVTEDGRVLVQTRIPTRAEQGAAAVLDRLIATARELISQQPDEAGRIGGIGVASPGIVREEGVELAPNNQGWEHVALTRSLTERLGPTAVAVDNDVKAATAAEATWGALAGVRDGVLVNVGTGFAAGAVVNGTLLRGAHGAGLEIAYQVPWTGRVRSVRQHAAPLEERFSGAGLAAAASALLGRPVDTAEVLGALAGQGGGAMQDPRLVQFAIEGMQTGARAIANLAIALDPQVIALCGGMLRSHAVIVPIVRDALEQFVPFPPRLVIAHFPDDAALAGACLLAYRAAGVAEPDELALPTTPLSA